MSRDNHRNRKGLFSSKGAGANVIDQSIDVRAEAIASSAARLARRRQSIIDAPTKRSARAAEPNHSDPLIGEGTKFSPRLRCEHLQPATRVQFRTWRSTPILHHSAWPDSRTSTRTTTRTKRLVRG
jgi:hypothetical protein